VVRLLGTNMKEAKDLLENSGARIIFASDLDEAAEKVRPNPPCPLVHNRGSHIGVFPDRRR
jgi:succinyl-CoA synthetase beta subunit